jgi:Icc-related predicted phosphoesterase
MAHSFFVSDLHGRRARYEQLFEAIGRERPAAVFLGGDLLPHVMASLENDGPVSHTFLDDYLVPGFRRLRERLGAAYPRVFLILGNDDARVEEDAVREAGAAGLWEYAHERRLSWGALDVYGYSWVPPTPFRLKDWERYDVSRHVEPGCTAPEDGWHTVPVDERAMRFATIRQDLEHLTGDADLGRAVLLCHTPPYDTALDRAALDGRFVEHVPLDVHVGSVAVRRLIEARQPLVSLHGHVHESARLTGRWRDRLGRTHAFSAAHDGPELALVRFDPEQLDEATRELL